MRAANRRSQQATVDSNGIRTTVEMQEKNAGEGGVGCCCVRWAQSGRCEFLRTKFRGVQEKEKRSSGKRKTKFGQKGNFGKNFCDKVCDGVLRIMFPMLHL